MDDEPRGARTHAIPLPQARQVKRAINSLDLGLEVRRPPARSTRWVIAAKRRSTSGC